MLQEFLEQVGISLGSSRLDKIFERDMNQTGSGPEIRSCGKLMRNTEPALHQLIPFGFVQSPLGNPKN